MSEVPPVLYVEDDENHVLLLKNAFRRAKVLHPLVHVDNGKAALELLSNASHPPPTLMLLDLTLPQLSGFDLLARIRSNPETKALRVLVFTTSEQPSDKKRAWDLGANDYIVKPSNSSGFAEFATMLKKHWLS
jgi:CheY-like chemotaxis protein